MSTPKIIIWDIETSHNITATFNMFDVNIPTSSILQEWFIISIAWKELGKPKVHAVYIDKPSEDKELIKKFYKVLLSADALVAHNGDRFDVKKFNARAIFHGLPPIPTVPSDDTLKMAKKCFKFNSNKLDYIGEILGVGRKIKTEPGLWIKVLKGNKRAIRDMVRYNKQDVLLLEAVYLKLKVWTPSKINMNLFQETKLACANCGSSRMQKRGQMVTKSNTWHRLCCKDCGTWDKVRIKK